MMLRPALSSFFVLASVAACAMPTAQSQQAQNGTQYMIASRSTLQMTDMGVHRDYRAWMASIANEYVMDTRNRDPRYLPNRINQCYQVQSGAIDRGESLRTCLILDYTGYKDAQEAAHRLGREPTGYFSMDASGERWKTFGPMSGFSDPDRMVSYMRDAYRFVQPDVINLRRHENAYLAQQ